MRDGSYLNKLMKAVTAAILRKVNAVILTHRMQQQWMAGCWVFPGGTFEDGDILQFSLKLREAKH